MVELTIFTETVQKSGLELSKAEKYALGYAPLMGEVIAIQEIIKGLDKTNAEHTKIAKRASLDIGKICSRLTDKKASDKSDLLLETKHIDNLFNLATSTARLTQKDADVIAEYADTIEKERLAKLADTRRAELESFGADTSYLPLDIMGDEQYARCLESAQLAFEARKVAAEKLEAERLQAIKDAEDAETERLRLQAERIEAERLESIRIREELAAKEQELVKEREAAKVEADRIAKEANERLVKQQEIARAEAEKLAKENESKLAEQKLLAEIESTKQAEIFAKQRAEAEKLAKELQDKKDAEAKEAESKRLATLAPDKDKINALYLSLKNLAIPDFTSIECQVIGTQVLNKISNILSYIKEESKKLS